MLAVASVHFCADSTADEVKVKTVNTDSADSLSVDGTVPFVDLNNKILFQLIASEIALQRQEAGAAYRTYLNLAEETKDPRIAKRAVEIAVAANAQKEFQKASAVWLKLAPDNRRAQEAYIQSFLSTGEFGKITALTKNYLSQSKDIPATISKLSSAIPPGKNPKSALAFFKAVCAGYENLPQTKLGLARLEALSGNFKAAKKYAEAAFKEDRSADAAFILASLSVKEDPQKAKDILSSYLKDHADQNKIRDAYTQLLAQTNDKDGLVSLAKQYANDPNYVLSLALILIQTGHPQEAHNSLDNFISKYKDREGQQDNLSRAYLLLSDLAIGRKDFSAALRYTQQVKGNLVPSAQLQTANIYSRQGENEKALASLKDIRSDDPVIKEDIALFEARLVSQIHGEKAAFSLLQQASLANPSSKTIHYETAMMAERLDDLKNTEKHLKEAINLDPNFANAYNALGYTLLERTKRLKEAAKYINRAYELEPDNPFILDSKGWLEFKRKKYKAAVNFLSEALKLSEEEDIYMHLIEAYWVKGDKAEALESYKKALSLWPNSVELPELKKRLRLP